MFRVILFLIWAVPAYAHEFWIAPHSMQLARGDVVEPTVMIGVRLDGQTHPFQPRAYAEAYWIGPNQIEPLHLRRISEGLPRLRAVKDGLHILAVATFPQTYTHGSGAAFNHYAKTEAMNATARHDIQSGPVRETYRRFSKTLIPIGDGTEEGGDRLIGLDYEWVQNADRFTLYRLQRPLAGQTVRLTCRTDGGTVLQTALVTDQTGSVPFDATKTSACLLNAVLLEKSGKDWESNWVSVYF